MKWAETPDRARLGRAATLFIAALALAARAAPCATTVVRPDGTGDIPTIQEAIAVSNDGDTILLTNGTFRGDGNRDLDFLGKAIVIASESSDPSQCVIDCEGTAGAPHRGFLFHSDEGPGSVLQWVKIINGYAVRGGGALCVGASPILRGLVFSGNGAEEGGGLALERSSPTIEFCLFLGNLVVNNGGGILCGVGFGDNSAPTIRNSTFSNNDALSGGAIHFLSSIPSILGCTFQQNTAVSGGAISCFFASPLINICVFHLNEATVGGAIWCESSSGPSIVSCTLVMNRAVSRGGGVYSKDSAPTLRNTIIAWSTGGEAVYYREGGIAPELSCCNLYGNRGGDWVGAVLDQRFTNGNIGADPLFCNRWLGNFTIGAASACAPAQSGSCGLIGAFGVGCSEVPTERTTWGSVKAKFR